VHRLNLGIGMYPSTCSQCGSTEFRLSGFQRKDFPTRFRFVECSRCGNSLGIIDLYAIHDEFHHREKPGNKLARILLEDALEG